MSKKTIKIFPAPHVEVRIYPSVKIMRKKVKENEVINTEKILTLIKKIICIKGLKKEIRRQIEENGKDEGENNV